MATRRLFDGATIEIGQVPIVAPTSVSTIVWLKVSSVWKQVTDVYIKVSGTWKQATAFIKIGGNWK
jgi:hypothetical protein